MKVLSVQNPYSYLICYGIKDIENRTYNTKHRGTILIHTPIKEACHILSFKELKIFQEMNTYIYLKDKESLSDDVLFKDFNNNSVYMGCDSEFYLKDIYKKDSLLCKEYALLKYFHNSLYESKKHPFLINAIIGSVDIVDVIKDSSSKWAIKNQYHYILEKAEIFDKPILQVKGQLGFWNYDIK